jgi:hypothetical protein
MGLRRCEVRVWIDHVTLGILVTVAKDHPRYKGGATPVVETDAFTDRLNVEQAIEIGIRALEV